MTAKRIDKMTELPSAAHEQQTPSLTTSRKLLCAVYAAIAVAALVATWSQNTAYLHAGIARFFADFLADVKVTPASRSITCDILFFFLAAAIFMVLEARKARHPLHLGLHPRWVSYRHQRCVSAFPDRPRAADGPPRLRVVDSILLAVLAVAFVALALQVVLIA